MGLRINALVAISIGITAVLLLYGIIRGDGNVTAVGGIFALISSFSGLYAVFNSSNENNKDIEMVKRWDLQRTNASLWSKVHDKLIKSGIRPSQVSREMDKIGNSVGVTSGQSGMPTGLPYKIAKTRSDMSSRYLDRINNPDMLG